MYKLRTLNQSNVDNIVKQAHNLTTVVPGFFWKKLAIIQKINYTAQKLVDALSTNKLLGALKRAIRMDIEQNANIMIFSRGLLPRHGYQ